jgi:hypothetical protein
LKIEAVRWGETSGKSISQMAKDLGIPNSNLSRCSAPSFSSSSLSHRDMRLRRLVQVIQPKSLSLRIPWDFPLQEILGLRSVDCRGVSLFFEPAARNYRAPPVYCAQLGDVIAGVLYVKSAGNAQIELFHLCVDPF